MEKEIRMPNAVFSALIYIRTYNPVKSVLKQNSKGEKQEV